VKDSGLSFNLSHTHSLIVLGVTRARALGVDVENVRTREVSMDIAHRYFAPREVSELMAAPAHEQQDRFFVQGSLHQGARDGLVAAARQVQFSLSE